MEDFNEIEVCSLLGHTLRDHPSQWCGTLPRNSLHSFKQFSNLIGFVFHHFELEVFDKNLLKKRKAPHESPMEFLERFCLFMFEAPKIEMKFQCLIDKVKYYLVKSVNP